MAHSISTILLKFFTQIFKNSVFISDWKIMWQRQLYDLDIYVLL